MTLSSAMQAPSTPSTLGELFGGIIDELSQFGVLQWSFLLVLVLALFLEITMVLKATPKRRKSYVESLKLRVCVHIFGLSLVVTEQTDS